MTLHHVCFGNRPECSGCNPCPNCSEAVERTVLVFALLSAGIGGPQAQAFADSLPAAWAHLHHLMATDATLRTLFTAREVVENPFAPQPRPQPQQHYAPPQQHPSYPLQQALPFAPPPAPQRQPLPQPNMLANVFAAAAEAYGAPPAPEEPRRKAWEARPPVSLSGGPEPTPPAPAPTPAPTPAPAPALAPPSAPAAEESSPPYARAIATRHAALDERLQNMTAQPMTSDELAMAGAIEADTDDEVLSNGAGK